jgi:catechol 2,3-dioxygenase-like lactoylglutathione lyase family enzyme
MPAPSVMMGAVEVPVSDLRRAVGWYVQALGFEEAWTDEHHALLEAREGPGLLLVATGPGVRLGFDCPATGLRHGVIDFRTNDLDALHARLTAMGTPVDPLDEPGNDWAPRGFGFEDSEGNRLAAFSYPPAR